MNENRSAGGELGDGHEPGDNLVWGVARSVTTGLEQGRSMLTTTVGGVTSQVGRLVGSLRDAGEDALAYFDPAAWLEDVYSVLGIASAGSMVDIDDRMDGVELKLDDVARQRAREELLLLQQRIGELEALIAELSRGEAHGAMEKVLGRLSELESRVEALPPGEELEERSARVV